MAARRKKKRLLRPRLPARVKRRSKRQPRTQRSAHQSELLGLGILAAGLVLSAILYLGLDGGSVGSWVADALRAVIGEAAYVLPLVLLAVGGLMVSRSELLDIRPFRLGVGIGLTGLMILLGNDNGGWVGIVVGGGLARLLGETGAVIVGGAILVAGALLVTGASTGAILKRTGHVVRRAGAGARRALDWVSSESQTEDDAMSPEPEQQRTQPQR